MDKLAGALVLRNVVLDPRSRVLERVARARWNAVAAVDAMPVPVEPAAPVLGIDAAHAAARREGYATGIEEGRAAGLEAGRESGFAVGHEEGHGAGREAGFAAGHAEGYAAGHEAGLGAGSRAAEEAVREAHRVSLERLAGIVLAAEQQVARRLEQSEDDMVELVFATVCRIAGELAVSRAGVRGMLRHSIAQLADGPLVAVRVHEQDLAVLRGDADFPAALERPGGPRDVQWVADERVELGGCRLESATGTLDLTLETQLARLRDTLLETRRARRRLQGDAC
jgi:flagellar assembly protein FliH